MPRSAAPIGDVKPAIHARYRVGVQDDELQYVAEAVEARLVVVPARIFECSKGQEGGAGAEAGAESQERGREDEEDDFGSHRALAEAVAGFLSGDEGYEDGDRERNEGEQGEVDAGHEADLSEHGQVAAVEGVEAANDGRDDHDEAGEDAKVQELEDPA